MKLKRDTIGALFVILLLCSEGFHIQQTVKLQKTLGKTLSPRSHRFRETRKNHRSYERNLKTHHTAHTKLLSQNSLMLDQKANLTNHKISSTRLQKEGNHKLNIKKSSKSKHLARTHHKTKEPVTIIVCVSLLAVYAVVKLVDWYRSRKIRQQQALNHQTNIKGTVKLMEEYRQQNSILLERCLAAQEKVNYYQDMYSIGDQFKNDLDASNQLLNVKSGEITDQLGTVDQAEKPTDADVIKMMRQLESPQDKQAAKNRLQALLDILAETKTLGEQVSQAQGIEATKRQEDFDNYIADNCYNTYTHRSESTADSWKNTGPISDDDIISATSDYQQQIAQQNVQAEQAVASLNKKMEAVIILNDVQTEVRGGLSTLGSINGHIGSGDTKSNWLWNKSDDFKATPDVDKSAEAKKFKELFEPVKDVNDWLDKLQIGNLVTIGTSSYAMYNALKAEEREKMGKFNVVMTFIMHLINVMISIAKFVFGVLKALKLFSISMPILDLITGLIAFILSVKAYLEKPKEQRTKVDTLGLVNTVLTLAGSIANFVLVITGVTGVGLIVGASIKIVILIIQQFQKTFQMQQLKKEQEEIKQFYDTAVNQMQLSNQQLQEKNQAISLLMDFQETQRIKKMIDQNALREGFPSMGDAQFQGEVQKVEQRKFIVESVLESCAITPRLCDQMIKQWLIQPDLKLVGQNQAPYNTPKFQELWGNVKQQMRETVFGTINSVIAVMKFPSDRTTMMKAKLQQQKLIQTGYMPIVITKKYDLFYCRNNCGLNKQDLNSLEETGLQAIKTAGSSQSPTEYWQDTLIKQDGAQQDHNVYLWAKYQKPSASTKTPWYDFETKKVSIQVEAAKASASSGAADYKGERIQSIFVCKNLHRQKANILQQNKNIIHLSTHEFENHATYVIQFFGVIDKDQSQIGAFLRTQLGFATNVCEQVPRNVGQISELNTFYNQIVVIPHFDPIMDSNGDDQDREFLDNNELKEWIKTTPAGRDKQYVRAFKQYGKDKETRINVKNFLEQGQFEKIVNNFVVSRTRFAYKIWKKIYEYSFDIYIRPLMSVSYQNTQVQVQDIQQIIQGIDNEYQQKQETAFLQNLQLLSNAGNLQKLEAVDPNLQAGQFLNQEYVVGDCTPQNKKALKSMNQQDLTNYKKCQFEQKQKEIKEMQAVNEEEVKRIIEEQNRIKEERFWANIKAIFDEPNPRQPLQRSQSVILQPNAQISQQRTLKRSQSMNLYSTEFQKYSQEFQNIRAVEGGYFEPFTDEFSEEAILSAWCIEEQGLLEANLPIYVENAQEAKDKIKKTRPEMEDYERYYKDMITPEKIQAAIEFSKNDPVLKEEIAQKIENESNRDGDLDKVKAFCHHINQYPNFQDPKIKKFYDDWKNKH